MDQIFKNLVKALDGRGPHQQAYDQDGVKYCSQCEIDWDQLGQKMKCSGPGYRQRRGLGPRITQSQMKRREEKQAAQLELKLRYNEQEREIQELREKNSRLNREKEEREKEEKRLMQQEQRDLQQAIRRSQMPPVKIEDNKQKQRNSFLQMLLQYDNKIYKKLGMNEINEKTLKEELSQNNKKLSLDSQSNLSNPVLEDIKQKVQRYSCPLSWEIMNDPVNASCGHTFERIYIEEFLNKSDRCPLCRESIAVESLRPNYFARQEIDSLKTKAKNLKIDLSSLK